MNCYVRAEVITLQSAGGTGTGHPQIIFESPLVQLWHKTETKFRAPKAVVYLSCQSAEAYQTPEMAVLCRIFTKLVEDNLSELSYDAHLAGLDFGINATTSGFLVSFSG